MFQEWYVASLQSQDWSTSGGHAFVPIDPMLEVSTQNH